MIVSWRLDSLLKESVKKDGANDSSATRFE
jgi:hypothetical protein